MSSISNTMSKSNKNNKNKNSKSKVTNNEENSKKCDLNQFIDYLMTYNVQLENVRQNMPDKADMAYRLNINDSILITLSQKISQILAKEANVLTLEGPIYLFGDIHGQFSDLVRFLDITGLPPKVKLLFLGDYVDRGDNSIEVIALLFSLKIKFPNNVFLIRGNHECSNLNNMYGFKEECQERYGNGPGNNVWRNINNALHHLPLSAVINEVIFCTHGGISPKLKKISDINKIKRVRNIPNQGLFCDLTWADPKAQNIEWKDNDRGCSYTFNGEALDAFMEVNEIQLVCRAHQVVNSGYKCFHNNKLVTIFSAPNYCGEVGNNGAIMYIDSDLGCSFTILKPIRQPLKRYDSFSTLPQE